MAIVDNAFREWIGDFKEVNPGLANKRVILDTAQYAFAAGRAAQRERERERLTQYRDTVARAIDSAERSEEADKLRELLALIDRNAGVGRG